jgi:hypothetical protein
MNGGKGKGHSTGNGLFRQVLTEVAREKGLGLFMAGGLTALFVGCALALAGDKYAAGRAIVIGTTVAALDFGRTTRRAYRARKTCGRQGPSSF